MKSIKKFISGQQIKIKDQTIKEELETITGVYNRIEILDSEIKKVHLNKLYNSGSSGLMIDINLPKERSIEELIIESSNNLKSIKINGGASKGYNFNKIILKDILLPGEEGGYYVFSGFLAENIEINEVTNLSKKLEFRDVYIDHLIIKNSVLGRMNFNGVEIGKLTLENVTLNDCIFNGVEFKDYELGEIKKPNGDVDYKKQKDNYRQLKHVMDKNGNYTEADIFYAKEKDIELQILTNKYNPLNFKDIFTRSFWKNIQSLDFLVFDLADYTKSIPLIFAKVLTNFGNNWFSGFIFLNIFCFLSTLLKTRYTSFIERGFFQLSQSYTPIIPYEGNFFYWLFIFWFLIYIFSLVLRGFNKLLEFFPIGAILLTFLGWYYLYDINLISEFLILLLNPFYGFNDFIINDSKNIIEIAGFVSYKLLYVIILWHLIVALKRTTKR